MSASISRLLLATCITGTVLLSTPLAMAHNQPQVNWSISVGNPYPAPVYSPPPVVYVQPAPVYVQPQPVYYVERAPMLQYRSYSPESVYVREWRDGRHRHEKHHHHHD